LAVTTARADQLRAVSRAVRHRFRITRASVELMNDAMSRIGSSLRPAVLRASQASAALLDDASAPPQPLAAVALAFGLDALACVLPLLLALTLLPDAALAEPLIWRLILLTVLLMPVATALSGAYRHNLLFRRGEQVAAVLRGGTGALAVVALAAALLADLRALPLPWAGMSAALLLGGLALGRLGLAYVLGGQLGRRFAHRVVIVGSGLSGTRLLRLLRQLDERSLRVVGMLDDRGDDHTEGLVESIPLLGPVAQLFPLLRRGAVEEVVLALPWSEERRILALIDELSEYPVHVRLAPDLISYHFPRCARFDLHGHPMLHLARRPISGWQGVLKRSEDLLIAGTALVLCAIPMMLIALAIRLDSRGPVLFRQKRTGFNNREFEMLKFRTMHHHLAEYRIRSQTTRNDPRVTRVGAMLRRTSLDELPQLFNVLRGEMSIVGPRPHAPGTRAGLRPFEQVVDRYAARHRVKPGLTGLAQVRGYRGETQTEEKLIRRVESDLEYIDSWSIWLDLVILLRTLVIVLRTKNAY
jgi:Undecaprenyl-phosphate glucose phosphotransferase